MTLPESFDSFLDVMPDWPLKRVDELCDVTRGASPRPIHEWIALEGTPWIKIADATADPSRYITKTREFIRNDGRSKSVVVRPGDLILSNSATPGIPKILGIEACIHDGWLLLRNLRDIDPKFFYYIFLNDRKHLAGQGNGSIFTNLKTDIVKAHTLRLPPLHEQQGIAEVLGALDDKIAANTKLAATTDEFLAARLSSLLDSGFEEIRLGDVAEVNAETVKPASGCPLRYIDIASVGVGSHEFPPLSLWDDAPSRARRRVLKGDTIWSTVRPNRRSHSLNLSEDPRLVGSTGLAVLSPAKVGFAYLYEVTKRQEFTAYLENVAEGSAYPAVRADRFTEAMIPFPPQDQRDDFETLAAPIREQIHSLSLENQTLAATRDALLPQLMSGKLRVKDVEALVSATI